MWTVEKWARDVANGKALSFEPVQTILFNSNTLDELGSWCYEVGGVGKLASWRKEVSMATLRVTTTKGSIALAQSVEYLPTRYLPELEGKAFNIASKVAALSTSKQAKHIKANIKQTRGTPCWTPGSPKPVRGAPSDQHFSILISPKFHVDTLYYRRRDLLQISTTVFDFHQNFFKDWKKSKCCERLATFCSGR